MANSDYLAAAVDIAREAGALLLDASRAGVHAEAKSDFDVVSEADHLSERLILERLLSKFPSHAVVAEEGGARGGSSTAYRWYVDPLDGTKNFVRGYPAFTVSLALECKGDLVLGVVFDPLRQEVFSAERGAGAFCNDTRIQVSEVSRLDDCLVATGFPSATRHRHLDVQLLCGISMTTQGIRRTGSSALDLCYVACGRVDAFWDVGLSRWDVAAGLVLVTEAGGCVSTLCGDRATADAADLLADNGRVHDSFMRVFTDVLASEVHHR